MVQTPRREPPRSPLLLVTKLYPWSAVTGGSCHRYIALVEGLELVSIEQTAEPAD
jgi:hypothetical protein